MDRVRLSRCSPLSRVHSTRCPRREALALTTLATSLYICNVKTHGLYNNLLSCSEKSKQSGLCDHERS